MALPKSLKQVTMTLLIMASLGMIGWKVTTRMSFIDEARSEIRSTYSLENEVRGLRTQWTHRSAGSHEPKVDQADQSLLQGFDGLAGWLHHIQREGRRMGVTTTYKVGKSESGPEKLEDVDRLPIEFEIRSSKSRKGYQNYLQFLQTLMEQDIRLDLTELNLTGRGNGAESMNLHVKVWMKREI